MREGQADKRLERTDSHSLSFSFQLEPLSVYIHNQANFDSVFLNESLASPEAKKYIARKKLFCKHSSEVLTYEIFFKCLFASQIFY